MFRRTKIPKRYYRTNYYIPAKELRLLDEAGKQVGVVSKEAAIAKAKELNVDVVEIAPNANPPVAKLINLKKFLYQEAKREREAKKNAKDTTTKEIRLGPYMGKHDLMVRVKKAKDYFAQGNKVKIIVQFSGRQITHPEFGHEVTKKFMEPFGDTIKPERPTHFEGRMLVTLLAPIKK